MVCASSEDSDQPGHLPSLKRVFAVRMKNLHWAQTKTLIRLGEWPGWSEFSLGAHVSMFVLSRGSSYEINPLDTFSFFFTYVHIHDCLHDCLYHKTSWPVTRNNSSFYDWLELEPLLRWLVPLLVYPSRVSVLDSTILVSNVAILYVLIWSHCFFCLTRCQV